MPTPFGHALAGIAAAWAVDLVPGRRGYEAASRAASVYERAGGILTPICAGLAAVPDADLIFGGHRTATHSIIAAVVVAIVAGGVTAWVTRGDGPHTTRSTNATSAGRVALMCGAAYATHLLLDWLQIDRNPPSGIQLLWPFSGEWFISGADLFPRTERNDVLSAGALRTNLSAIVFEAALLLPIVVALWSVRVKALARFAAKLSRGDHAA
jgi:membrane-bound metal-dependent hydrolase YbcI (DUF457 family)